MRIDLKKIKEYHENALLRIASDKDLIQINYTDKTMYKKLWDEVTLNARGHIYNRENGELVCPCMSKFFNFNELRTEERKEILKEKEFITTVKYDGSLGLIYKYKGELRCNSRGSFDSKETKIMWKIINRNSELKKKLEDLKDNISLSVEIISPQTRVIVDYGDREELILITGFINGKLEGLNDTDKVKEFNYEMLKKFGEDLGLKVAEERKMSLNDIIEWCKTHDGSEEGFVVRFKDNRRIKFKSIDYVELSALKSQLNYDSLLNSAINFYMNPNIDIALKQIESSKVLEDRVMKLPDELYEQGRAEIEKIKDKRDKIYKEIEKIYEETKGMTNKEISLNKKYKKNKDFIFAKRLNRVSDIERWILQNIKKELEK